MTLDKRFWGGIAGGALLAKKEVAKSLRPGMHAATFGGNPIAARAGIATIETIEEQGLLERATQLGEAFRTQLAPLVDELPFVKELRVRGLMIGLELTVPGAPIVQRCLDNGLLINCTQGNVIRLLPAMTLTDEELENGCDILIAALREHTP
jgi:acetylornithine/succinyldiaminopimelate/putrescine aminotransferase